MVFNLREVPTLLGWMAFRRGRHGGLGVASANREALRLHDLAMKNLQNTLVRLQYVQKLKDTLKKQGSPFEIGMSAEHNTRLIVASIYASDVNTRERFVSETRRDLCRLGVTEIEFRYGSSTAYSLGCK